MAGLPKTDRSLVDPIVQKPGASHQRKTSDVGFRVVSGHVILVLAAVASSEAQVASG